MDNKSYQIDSLFPENNPKILSEQKEKKPEPRSKFSMPKSLIRELTRDSARKLLIPHIPSKHE